MADHDFCRTCYKMVVEEIKKMDPSFKVRDYWQYDYKDGCREVQNESGKGRKLYWYGQAHCAWHAKYLAFSQLHREIEEEKMSSDNIKAGLPKIGPA